MPDLATRAYNHSFKIDPIVRSLLDTDFYKLLMGQYIFQNHDDVEVTFQIHVRSPFFKIRDLNRQELIEQLDHVRSLQFSNSELIWLQGNTFYGKRGMFSSEYIDFLRNLRLPEYEIIDDDSNGDLIIRFPGKWAASTMWEIHSLAVVNTLRNRHVIKDMSRFELDILYSHAKTKVWKKLQMLKHLEDLNLTDFGTRRRHDFLFQEWVVNAACDALGKSFTGSSNTLIAMRHGLEAKGTNAHEIPMVLAALADTDEAIKNSQYVACKEWQATYDGQLLIGLPDTFGSTQYFRDAPDWLLNWTGFRFDSKEPISAGEEMINWLIYRGIDPMKKLGIFSDGLDVNDIIKISAHFKNRMRFGFGWGTMLTNDFIDCNPRNTSVLNPISITCKAVYANGRPTVKLSDNFRKASGPDALVKRYLDIFENSGMNAIAIKV